MMNKFNKQKGVSLIEALATLIIFGVTMVGVYYWFDSYAQQTRGHIAAQQITTFGKAMDQYLAHNYDAILDNTASGQAVVVTADMLKKAEYLPSEFNSKNSFGQTVCGLVKPNDSGILNGLVITEGGETINDVDLGRIASLVGAQGGGIYQENASVIKGTLGGWKLPTSAYAMANTAGMKCDGSPGTVDVSQGHAVMALWYKGADPSEAFLHRNAIHGKPELNRMNTDIDMDGHNINNAGSVNARQVNGAEVASSGRMTANEYLQVNGQAVEGAACSPNGLIASTNTGLILSCQSGTWKKASGSGGKVRRRSATQWNYVAAFCAPNEVVINGLSSCPETDHGRPYIPPGPTAYSPGEINGWYIDCKGPKATATAICLEQ